MVYKIRHCAKGIVYQSETAEGSYKSPLKWLTFAQANPSRSPSAYVGSQNPRDELRCVRWKVCCSDSLTGQNPISTSPAQDMMGHSILLSIVNTDASRRNIHYFLSWPPSAGHQSGLQEVRSGRLLLTPVFLQMAMVVG